MSYLYSRINEALRLSVAKKFSKLNPEAEDVVESHQKIFGDKKRIYLEVGSENTKITPEDHMLRFRNPDGTYHNIKQLYRLGDRDARDMTRMLEGLSAFDYKYYNLDRGVVKKEGDNRWIKINKAVAEIERKLKRSDIELQSDFIEKVHRYNNLRSQGYFSAKPKKFFAVISRHPYDIAGMSTDRGWKSCMNLGGEACPTGSENIDDISAGNSDILEEEIEKGTFVAYLVKEDDKNIKNPTARIAIKPYRRIEEYTGFDYTYVTERKYRQNYQKAIKEDYNKYLDVILSDYVGHRLEHKFPTLKSWMEDNKSFIEKIIRDNVDKNNTEHNEYILSHIITYIITNRSNFIDKKSPPIETMHLYMKSNYSKKTANNIKKAAVKIANKFISEIRGALRKEATRMVKSEFDIMKDSHGLQVIDDYTAEDGGNIYFDIGNNVYGTVPGSLGFIRVIKEWLIKKQSNVNGMFSFNGEYHDGEFPYIYVENGVSRQLD